MGLFIFAALAGRLFAANLNCLVVEAGVGAAASDSAPGFESSILWENSVLDVFFEAGHIVSNSPILRVSAESAKNFPGKDSPTKPFPPELRVELDDAATGGADYFVLVLLNYPEGTAGSKTRPSEVSLRIYKVYPYRFVYEGNSILASTSTVKVSVGQAQENEGECAKRLIRGLIPHLKD
jgi:hypothetical protein